MPAAIASLFTLVATLLALLIWGGQDSSTVFALVLLWMLLAAMGLAVLAVVFAVKRHGGQRTAIVILALPGLLTFPITIIAFMNAIDQAFR